MGVHECRYAESVGALQRAVALDGQALHRFNLAESLRMTDDMAGALRELERAVSEARPRLMDAEALLIFYRRLVCDWSRYAEDVATLEGVMSQQLLSGEQAALFAVQTLVFPLPPHLHLFSAQSLASAASRSAALQLSRQGGAATGADAEPRAGALPSHHSSHVGARRPGAGRTRLHPAAAAGHVLNVAPARGRLRLGYVTSDLFGHPVSDDLAAVWKAHDVRRVQLVCFLTPSGRIGSAPLVLPRGHACAGSDEDGGGGTRDLRKQGIREAADAIWAEEVMVLVNLHGWTAGHAMGMPLG